ncbi:MAG: DUF3048 C-terminal domain-containing protein [Anaerolineaceae bacterium]|nr:DUF3048 C-terminal domain-containing protein [Anaerolineaceae bacterium]MDI9530346.1 DUF3048 C-terminal domain-containing protein [Chloroflexota bacterium]
MKKYSGILLVLMTLALVISACGSSSMPALTEAEQTAVAGTVTAVFAAIESSAEPSVTPSPEPSATPLPEPTPTPVVPIGPNSYPEGVNPLTGLKVENPELLQRRPVIMKISNHQIDYQPQWGLSKADLVFEYYIGWGANRFSALFYGQDCDRIGPVRSIRRVDGHIGSLYQGVVGSTGGDGNEVLPYLWNYIPGRFFTDKYLCPGVCDDGRNLVYSVFGDSAALSNYFNYQGYGLENPDLGGMAFSGAAPEGGEAGASAWITFGAGEGADFVYDETSGKYLRFAMDETTSNIYSPSVDQNTNEQLAFSNLIVINVPYTEYKDTLHSIDLIGNTDGLPATVFRDGKAYQITWKTPDSEKPIQFFDGNGKPFLLKPGNTWIVLMGTSSLVNIEGGKWSFTFSIP